MTYIPSTAEIVAFKALNFDIDEKWVNWALEMMQAGFESENIIILAGESQPFNQFELQRLTDKIFKELQLKTENMETVFKNYICYLTDTVNSGKMTYTEVLKILSDLYIEHGYLNYLQEFALLYWAKDELSFSNISSYWPDADSRTIDTIITNHFIEWNATNCEE